MASLSWFRLSDLVLVGAALLARAKESVSGSVEQDQCRAIVVLIAQLAATAGWVISREHPRVISREQRSAGLAATSDGGLSGSRRSRIQAAITRSPPEDVARAAGTMDRGGEAVLPLVAEVAECAKQHQL
jgi:hypothetical protein